MRVLILFLWPLIGLLQAQHQNQYQGQYQNQNQQYQNQYNYQFLKCPEHWVEFQDSCYRFIKSPLKPFTEARRICQTFTQDDSAGGGDLLSVGSLEEHGFLVNQLNWQDPQHRLWYVGAQQRSANYWVNPDGTQLTLDSAFLPDRDLYGKDNLVYNYSTAQVRWGFQPVRGDEPLLFICESHIATLQRLVTDDRTYLYGIEVGDPLFIPRGPWFIQQPSDVTFDLSRNQIYNDVSLSCLAGGYPTPTYEWFREDYENDRLIARPIDPLTDSRFTLSGGMLLINNPEQKRDRATYHCKASNRYGTIISESVQLNFGFISEFVLRRSPEAGDQNWGKVVYCDPPTHFPSVKYSFSRDYFPNFVEEDNRIFVSNDGALYFSALETIDRANYSCSVQAEFSDTGRNGPFFPLRVNPHSNYQQLKFANNFPKAFPDAPIAGKEVRLECTAFGYPVPSYNWTRAGGRLPRGSYFSSYNRVLIIPKVQVQDQGEYKCRSYNDRAVIEHSVILNIQAEPNFTIPLTDKHIDSKGELVWTCEAFGIPDVNYTWWKNGRQLVMGYLDNQDRGRIRIQDNVLRINYLDDERDPGMYQCRASNTLKTRYSSAQLRVLAFKPSFKKRPLEIETYAAEQGNVTMVCNPEAAPRPRFTWKQNGNVLGPGGHRQMLENGNLIISPVSRNDEGLYTCTANNELGMDESRGRLIVLHGPRLVEPLPPQMLTTVGREIALYCSAETEEMLDIAYLWNHNGLRVKDDSPFDPFQRVRIDGGTLFIVNATFSDAGLYECIVKSAVGRISSRCNVIIEGPPGPPGGLQVINIQRSTATLQWTDGAIHGHPALSYSINARTMHNRTWVNVTKEDQLVYAREIDRNTGRRQLQLEDGVLAPWSTYEFRVAAWNEKGLGVYSAPSPRHSTPPDRPWLPPSNIGGGGGKIGDLTITWLPLRLDQQNGPGIHYKIFWKRLNDETEFQKLELTKYGNANTAVVHIPLDAFYTQYIVKVQSLNEIGPGPVSEEYVVYSAEDMPQVAPQLVVGLSFNSTALNVSWNAIDERRETVRGKLIGHRIKYWRKDNREEDSVYYLSRTTRPWALIVGLIPDTYYYVKVMAYNAAGEGPESERYIERTYKKAPQKPPFSVQVYGVNPSTVRVVWRYVNPSQEEEPLQGYKIRIWESDQDISTANDTFITLGDKLQAYIDNLAPGKMYKMRVLAYSNGGDGRMSSPELGFQMGGPAHSRITAPSGQERISSNLIACIPTAMILIYSKRSFDLL